MPSASDGDVSIRKVLNEIIGISPSLVRLRRAIRKVAKVSDDILITGEPGVGKRFFSYKIHQLSSRASGPYFAVECSTLSGKSFDEAVHNKFRRTFQKAQHGTLALHSIEKLTREQQANLFLVLNDYARTNGSVTSESYDVRVIATTQIEPYDNFSQKGFDAKLYYRISKIILNVPPLRNRKQDIPFLFDHFLREFSENGAGASLFDGVPSDLYDALMSYEWRGNVEELENSVRALLTTTKNGAYIPEALPFLQNNDPLKSLLGMSLPEATSHVEKYLLANALGRFEGNQTKAAQHLDISEASLRYKLKKYEISNK